MSRCFYQKKLLSHTKKEVELLIFVGSLSSFLDPEIKMEMAIISGVGCISTEKERLFSGLTLLLLHYIASIVMRFKEKRTFSLVRA